MSPALPCDYSFLFELPRKHFKQFICRPIDTQVFFEQPDRFHVGHFIFQTQTDKPLETKTVICLIFRFLIGDTTVAISVS
jgi:hypothetical protein